MMSVKDYFDQFRKEPFNFVFVVATGVALAGQVMRWIALWLHREPWFFGLPFHPMKHWLEAEIILLGVILVLHIKDNVGWIKVIKHLFWALFLYYALVARMVGAI